MSQDIQRFKWKYDLCENEIQCEGRTIAYSDNSVFGIQEKNKFNEAIRSLGMKLGWLIERANATAGINPKAIQSLYSWAHANVGELECRGDADCDHCHLRQILTVADGELLDFPDDEDKPTITSAYKATVRN
jgi:hypothetical protein